MALTDFREQLRGNLGYPARLGSLLVDFVESGSLSREVNEVLQSLANHNVTILSKLGTDMLMLLEDDDFVLQLKKFQGSSGPARQGEASAFLCTPASDALVLLKGRGRKWVRRYQIDGDIQLEVFTPGVGLRLLDEREYDGGVVEERIADKVVYDYGSDAEFMMLRLAYRPFADQCWHFDNTTLQSRFPSAGLMDQSALVNTAKVLGALGDPAAVPHLVELAEHPSHFVRWAAIQAVGRLDRARAVELLRRSLEDAHPHVRSMAAKVLAKVGIPNG